MEILNSKKNRKPTRTLTLVTLLGVSRAPKVARLTM